MRRGTRTPPQSPPSSAPRAPAIGRGLPLHAFREYLAPYLTLPDDNRLSETERIHETRRTIKRLRALWRLLRACGATTLARAENRRLRDAARRLSAWRDHDTRMEAMRRVKAGCRRDSLRRQAEALTLAMREEPAPRGNARQRLTAAAAVIRHSHALLCGQFATQLRWRAPAAGLALAWRKARRCYAATARRPNAMACHEWRKRVKDLQYQLELFAGGKGATLKPARRALQDIARHLGLAQDLTAVHQWLQLRRGQPHRRPLTSLDVYLTHLQERHQRAALRRGGTLFADAAKAWMKSLKLDALAAW